MDFSPPSNPIVFFLAEVSGRDPREVGIGGISWEGECLKDGINICFNNNS